MIYGNIKDVEGREMKTFLVKGKQEPVVGTTVKWLSQVGEPTLPEYGLRLFTIKPGGYLPEHQHQYAQTQYMLTGKALIFGYKDEKKVEAEVGPGDYFYVPSMEMHGMRNIGNKDVTFFCCICVLGE